MPSNKNSVTAKKGKENKKTAGTVRIPARTDANHDRVPVVPEPPAPLPAPRIIGLPIFAEEEEATDSDPQSDPYRDTRDEAAAADADNESESEDEGGAASEPEPQPPVTLEKRKTAAKNAQIGLICCFFVIGLLNY